ncbi:hypothetical protein BT63DRAFT_426109 [Microthyrium microscopicum]|uniref:Purine-cytosine permease FCY2 n=1 Tax=Microthyrium microscopicum TaxID=703497 RepID=A0A6A6UB54_9PEZI|nr:hypothetical protein BT63DRAFT_426109 [Microthyrium microscopicum]
MISTTGWNAINSISGASVLNALSNGACPTWAGVIIICTLVWIVCALGINWIQKFDAYLWIPPLACWIFAAAGGAPEFSGNAVKSPTGSSGAAAALTFMAVIFSFAVSWVNCASDYNVRMPLQTPRWKIFVATYVGICVPTVLVQTLGAAIYSGAQHNHAWKAAFVEYGVGGPLALSVARFGGFGKLLLAFSALSAVPNNIPNNYSFAMHAQNFGPWAIRIPRIALVTFGYVVAVIVGCLATKFFSDTLQTFLSIIGYWTIVHIVVVAEEHIIFRGSNWKRYDWEAWYNPDLLPFGWAAIGAFIFGFVGAVLGMKVSWFVGPVAHLIGKKGANIGHELTFAFSSIAFPALRYLEKKYTGK